jgi:formylglycine-generating enzyme required for sulfatase activity
VYSLGATLYYLLTGLPPFREEDLSVLLDRVVRGAFPAPRQVSPAVPVALDAVCRAAMATSPGQRYASARALADDVEHWLADEPVSVHAEPFPVRAGRWARRHRTGVTALAVIVLAGLVSLSVGTVLLQREHRATRLALDREQEARRQRALAQVHALLDARPEAVPSLLDGLEPFRDDVEPELRRLWDEPAEGDSRSRRVRVGLALLRFDPPAARDPLFRWMLDADEPQELLLLCRALEPHRDQLIAPLWRRVEDSSSPEQRFRALVALVVFGADRDRWRRFGDLAVEQLLSADPLLFPHWTEALRPARHALLAPLAAAFRADDPERRRLAATVAAGYAGDDPGTLADLVADADERQYAILWPAVQRLRVQVAGRLEKELLRPSPAEDQAEARDALARRQAQAAVALLQLGREEPAWRLLRHSRDPGRRTHLIHRLAALGTDPRPLVRRLDVETDVSARRALLLCLGTFGDDLHAETRRGLRPGLLKAYRDDPDPGIHSALDWLLRQWGGEGDLAAINAELSRQPPGRRDWHVNGQGQTFAVFRGPCRFRMGSPDARPMTVPRSFALATREVTVEQFLRFRKDHPYRHQYSPGPTGPIIDVSWYEAAAYCNWLSEREGIPKCQWCYPEKVQAGMTLPRGYLSRTGYRLPTEAEWEYACRAGAITSRFYGDSRDLLNRYAWYVRSTHSEGTRPVGLLMPNDGGLFDMLGNAAEWCDSRPRPAGGPASEDGEDEELVVRDDQPRVYRGGGFFYRAAHVQCAYRLTNQPTYRNYHVGFRPARTVR